MNRRFLRRAVGLVAALAFGLEWCGPPAVRAEEPAASELKTQALVMQSGQVLKGSISRSPNGYVVEHSAGRLVVPFEDAWVVGDDLKDAYRRMAESFAKPTAATHYELALWTWSHQLKAEARAELVMTLDRDPEHAAARDMLKRVDEQLAADRRRAGALKQKPPPPRIVGGIELPEIESLGGLSRETAAQFTGRIQPLVINKCGNATCHGSNSETGFRLEQIRGTGPGARLRSERNLAAILKHVDRTQPQRSPLLTLSAGNHGGLNRAIFYGPNGERQLQLLKAWVRTASKELTDDALFAAERPSVVAHQPKFPPTSAPQSSLADDDESFVDRPMASVTKPKSEPSADDEDELDDAFDPEVFNRRYHGPAARAAPVRKSKP